MTNIFRKSFTALFLGLTIFSTQVFGLGISSVSPKAFQTNVPPNSEISVTFDRNVKGTTVNNNTFRVFSTSRGLMTGTLSLENGQKTIYFTPDKPFAAGERIQVVVTSGILSDGNDFLQDGYGWQFDVASSQGLFEFSTLQQDGGGSLSAVNNADINGDGIDEIVVAGMEGGTGFLKVFFMQNNFLVEGETIKLPFYVRPILVGDLNNDGTPDLVLIHRLNTSFTTVFVSKSGALQIGTRYTVGRGNVQPRSGALIDLNNDGFLDLALVKRTRNTNDEKTILVFLNDGTGVLGNDGRETDWFWSDPLAEYMFSSDLNLDGYADILATVQGTRGGLNYFKNPGNGWLFADDPDAKYSISSDIECAVDVDLDGDRLPDIIGTDITNNRLLPFRMRQVKNGLPDYILQSPVPSAENANWIDYADIDADGNPDVVVNGDSPTLYVHRNRGNGEFDDPITFDLPSSLQMHATGDYNGDGAADIAVVGQAGLSLLLNIANGNTPPEAPTLLSPPDEQFLNSRTVELAWQAPADIDENSLHFYVDIVRQTAPGSALSFNSLDNPELFSPTPPVPQNGGHVLFTTTLPNDGRYRWSVRAHDGFAFGNPSSASNFTIDFSPPENVSISFPQGLYNGYWLDPQVTPNPDAAVNYTESHPDRAELNAGELGGVLTNSPLPAGVDQQTLFQIDISDAPDGQYPLTASVYDSAGLSSTTHTLVGVDRNPPAGTKATSVADTVASEIVLSWSGGSDGAGSGLSGQYSVQVRMDDGPWTLWLDRVATADTFFVGENLHSYSFEAAAWDNVGHFEGFTNTPEVTVFIDASQGDVVPPGRPKNLTANGTSPSPWGTAAAYQLSWESPNDISGIERSYYKIGSPPTSNSDVTGVGPAVPPFAVETEIEDGVNLYLWLEDKKGNVDFNNHSVVLLRRDITLPAISGVEVSNAQPPYVDPTERLWFRAADTHELHTSVTYTEKHPASAKLSSGGLDGDLILQPIPSGTSVNATFNLILDGTKEGEFDMEVAIIDSAGNSSSMPIGIGLDGSAPVGSVAMSTDTSVTETFKVSWTAGEDTYSGLSGRYDVYVSIDNGAWQQWLADFAGNESEYTGQHGRSYRFESLAKDHVGNIEKFEGLGETTVFVDTTADDIIAPAPPNNLTANGQAGTSQWQKSSSFVISWENPSDESGIVKSYYKFGTPPVAPDDFSGFAGANPPLVVTVPQDGVTPFYLWLQDSRGNVNFNNYSVVLLRSDATPPIVSQIQPTNPDPAYDPGNGQFWYNSNQVSAFNTKVRYTEQFPLRVLLDSDGLLGVMTNLNVPAGENAETEFHLDVSGASDGLYQVTATVEDSATNSKSAAVAVGLDGQAPINCVATSPEISANETFAVSWSEGSDQGSGLSGVYDVYVRIDNGGWQPWQSNVSVTSAEFTGQNGHKYSFEAVTRDNVGNVEPRTSVAETTTEIDLTANDNTPPDKPKKLTAGGSAGQSPWQTSSKFIIDWTNPNDQSGIAKSYWKLGSPPTYNVDTTRTGPARGPVTFTVSTEGQHTLYLWLADNRGNIDYRNHASVVLRYDKTGPVVNSLQYLNPDYADNWFNQKDLKSVSLRLNYSERNLDSLIVRCDALDFSLVSVNPQSGIDISRLVSIPVDGRPDTSGAVMVRLVDMAGNTATAVDSIHLDSSPPVNSVAHSPDISFSQQFLVSWSQGDDAGVGLSGQYDVYVRSGNNAWALWKSKFEGREAYYTGEHGKKYQFEALAYDHLQNLEVQTGVAESTTLIDTTASDSIPPAAPLNMAVDGNNPSRWQDSPTFYINWDNPRDQSGIVKSYYKLGRQPSSPSDTTGSGPGLSPLKVTVTRPEGQWCHVWLMDGHGNVDINNYSSIYLRWDDRVPVIDSLVLAESVYQGRWYNPNLVNKAELQVYFSEKFPKSFRLEPSSLFGQEVTFELNDFATAHLSIPAPVDTTLLLVVTVEDSAGQTGSDSTLFSLDASAPVNTMAAAPDTAAPGEITVTWSGGVDPASGSGLSGAYDVKMRVNGGEWELWQTRTHANSASFSGENGSLYEFEAAAWDNVGNREEFHGVAEAATFVSEAFSDDQPPPAPSQLAVANLPPSGWIGQEVVEVNWQNPDDVSGIASCFYKIGSPPQFNTDTTGTLPGIPPGVLPLEKEGRYYIFFWLKDGRGNIDFHNYDSLLVKYDATPPQIDSSFVSNADYIGKWISPSKHDSALVRIVYKEANLDSVHLFSGAIAGEIVRLPGSTSDTFVEFPFDLSDLTDGCFQMAALLSDSAGNTTADTLWLCIDGTPPDSSTASSPEVSQTPEITVSWADEGRGTDFGGSGLSGEYDVRIQINDGPWFDLVKGERRTSLNYIGVHGFSYGFEVAAWDNVGQREPFRGVAETTTRIDTALIDAEAPPAPLNLAAAGNNPSSWQSSPMFQLSWDNPLDPSGIARLFYKLDDPPTSAADTTGSFPLPDSNRVTIRATRTEQQIVYVWLADGKGNVDFRNYAAAVLRWDPSFPVVKSVVPLGAKKGENWYNQKQDKYAPLRIFYFENHLKEIIWVRNGGETALEMTGYSPTSDSLDTRVEIESFPDGAHYFVFVLVDSAGNHSEPDSLLLQFDSTPPVISHTQADTVVDEGTALSVSAVIKDANSVESASLLYWRGGQRSKPLVDMVRLNDSTFTGSIPADFVGSRGLEYVILSSDGLSTSRMPGADAIPASFSVRVHVSGQENSGLEMSHALTAGSNSQSYRMISVPLDLDQKSVETVFADDLGKYDPAKWRLFQWVNDEARFREYPDVTDCSPGKVFWLITTLPDIIIDSGPGLSVATSEPVVVPLEKGWNDIGNPFNFPIDWDEVLAQSSVDTQKVIGPYAWDGSWKVPAQVSIAEPWSGYSFYTEEADLSLVIPPSASKSSLGKRIAGPTFAQADWWLCVSVENDLAADRYNFLGTAEESTEDWDFDYDFPEPPGVSSYVSLYFPHEEWPLSAKKYTSDFRSMQSGQTWAFEVTGSSADKPFNMTVRNAGALPPDVRLHMVDLDANVSVDLQKDSTYSFWLLKNKTIRRFKILAGTDQYMAEHKEELLTPDEYELLQNYPNPFNGSTVIQYELVAETHINLAIYNLLGQKVRTIYSGSKGPGLHTFQWDATDDNGRDVGTGIYILRFETPKFKTTKKMIYMR